MSQFLWLFWKTVKYKLQCLEIIDKEQVNICWPVDSDPFDSVVPTSGSTAMWFMHRTDTPKSPQMISKSFKCTCLSYGLVVKLLSSFPLTERTYRYTASSKHDADIYRMCSGSNSSTRRKPRPVYFCSIAVPNPREHSCWSDQPAKQRMGVSMRSNSIKRTSEYWIHPKCMQTMPVLLRVIVLLSRIFYRNKFLAMKTNDKEQRIERHLLADK